MSNSVKMALGAVVVLLLMLLSCPEMGYAQGPKQPISPGGGEGGAVLSVAGKTGVVTLAAGDVASGTFNIARMVTGTATASRCLQISADGTAIEVASAACGTGSGGDATPNASALVASGTSVTVTHSADLSDPYAFTFACMDEDDGTQVIPSSLTSVGADAVTFNFGGTVTNVRCTVNTSGGAAGAGDDLGDADAAAVVALFGGGACSGYLKDDGTCDTPSSGVSAVTRSLSLDAPSTADTGKYQIALPAAMTVLRVWCSTDLGTVTIQFDERAEATPNTAGTDVLTAALVCDNDTEATTSFANASIAQDVPMNLQITATSGSPNVVRIHIRAQ